jgi:exopolysaccharide biosynthesis polyprenyl glycosylphosphotransferase
VVRTWGPFLADTVAGILAAVALGSLGRWTDLTVAVCWAAVVAVATRDLRRPGPVRVAELGKQVVTAGLVLVFLAVALAGALGRDVDPVHLAGFAIVTSAVAIVHRGIANAVDARHPSRALRIVVAGHRHGVEQMLAEVRDAGSPVTVVAACLTGEARSRNLGIPVALGLDALGDCVRQHGADAVVVVPCRRVGPAQLRRLGWQLERHGTQLFVGTGLCDLGPGRARLAHAGPLPLIEVRHAALRGGPRLAKATWERLAAGLALVALAPLILALALVIRLESNGPALFRQTRVGRDGVPFTMLKFRTMCVDAEDRLAALAVEQPRDGVLFKMRDDPRITRVGRLLRRYSLDEVPQLINVLRGEMALVGPRPPLPTEVAQYDGDVHRRLAVTPGLTGLWQVSGRSDLSWEQSVRLDLRYVENWSLGLDLAIVLRTVGAVLGHRGAY